jgi:hypothetical protein
LKYLLILNKNKNIAYITFNDYFSGIYTSQVIDVLNFYEKNNIKIRLITFVSIRFYFSEKRKIKKYYNRVLVIPIFLRLKYWSLYRFILLFLIYNDKFVICRGIFSANLALISKREKCKIIYDGRGAISAEQNEYGVYNNSGLENKIHTLEKRAVLESDYRISVSNKLLNYWYGEFNYKSKDHVVIPSSCSNNYNNKVLDREDLNISENSILVVFSGSISKWHSYSKMISDFTKILNKNPRVNLLFLSKLNSHIAIIKNKFPERVFVFWVDPKDVFSYLNIADYGYVVREDSITNQVSSPVKIAEYLSCGLKILISKNIGDYSEMIEKNDLGYIIENYKTIYLEKVNISEKEKIISFYRSNLALYSDKISQRYLNLINENCSNN